MPQEWNKSVIIPLPKKGDLTRCNNYRGIALQCVGNKVFATWLLRRLAPLAMRIVGQYQCGFMPGRSTIDQVSALRRILEHRWVAGKSTQLLFIDFKKAYDCIHRPALYAAMRTQGIPEELISLIKTTQDDSACAARVHGHLSDFFNVASGVKQCDPLSPLLFNLALEAAVGGLLQRLDNPTDETFHVQPRPRAASPPPPLSRMHRATVAPSLGGGGKYQRCSRGARRAGACKGAEQTTEEHRLLGALNC